MTIYAGVLASLTFAIGSPIKTWIENVIFLFITHPFDLGDKIVVEKTRKYIHRKRK
jgi:small-conductance mechanosensitive channel